MSRSTIRSTCDICADCNAPEPGWASINRGVFVCHECCSVHRSLGRHISQVKSLKRGSWSSSQLSMVHELVSMGANSIWEHSLLDPSQGKHGRRKPNPRDPIHPTKADFVRAKYQFLAFVNKSRDSEVVSSEDLSKQLHSSVRTGNVLTSLRLLSLGADPNFFHPERGNSPLHVAAGEGQALQVELLVVYGADPGAFDSQGQTPLDHARKEGHTDLVDRLLECQFELTDRLAFYLCNRKPDHRGGQHFIIPEMADSSLDMSELAKAARKKLQALPNNYFEELAKDVYDEVDRRENESIVWQANQTQSHTSMLGDSSQAVPFLPVNPEFTSTRNQGRQKLARFNKREFATLIIDILSDAKRRQQHGMRSSAIHTMTKEKGERAIPKPRRSLVKTSSLSDDEPLYDSVASDEDYASIGDNQSMKEEKLEKISDKSEKTGESIGSSDTSEAPITLEEYLDVKHGMVEAHARITQMAQANKDLKQEITLLQNMVQRLIQENELLKSGDATGNNHHIVNGQNGDASLRSTNGRQGNRPQSMFEPRDSQKQHQQHWSKMQPLKEEAEKPRAGENDQPVLSATAEAKAHLQMRHKVKSSNETEYDNSDAAPEPSSSRSSGGRSDSSQVTPTNTSHTPPLESALGALGAMVLDGSGEDLIMPIQEDVVRKTEKITKKIQELLISSQEGKLDTYINCSEKITTAVTDMAALFPKNIQDKNILGSLEQLTNGSARLKEQCATPDSQIADIHLHNQDVIQCAYDIAKAAKQLVIQFE